MVDSLALADAMLQTLEHLVRRDVLGRRMYCCADRAVARYLELIAAA